MNRPAEALDEAARANLARALVAEADAPALDADPPHPGAVWDALDDADTSQSEALLAALLATPHGHQELALLVEFRAAFAEDEVEEALDEPNRGWLWAAGVLAAAILVAALAWPSSPKPQPEIEFRAPAGNDVGSLVTASSLPRDRFELLWTAPAADCSYTLRLSTAAPRLIRETTEIATPRFVVPASDFAGLPPQAALLWQVDYVCTDGLRGQSPTFSVQLQ